MSGQIKLKAASLGGDITLTPTDTASNLVVTIPAVTATLLNNQSNIEAQVKTATNASGSAPIYSCRAWVNFNGTGTIAIRASGNVSSITDNGTGLYTVNFTTAMQDADYAAVAGGPNESNGTWITYIVTSTQTASTLAVVDSPSAGGGGGRVDHALVNVAVFR
jgi:hypothetical protein